MRVLKFGGSSVANATAISRVLDLVSAAASEDRVIVVCSAIRGCTDELIAIGEMGPGEDSGKAIAALKGRHLSIIRRLFTGSERAEAEAEIEGIFDEIASFPTPIEAYGEILSTKIIARKLSCEGESAMWLDSRRFIRVGVDGKVRTELSYPYIMAAVDGNREIRIFIAPGFIGSDLIGNTVTLGRGGSDYSAALYAAGSAAGTLEIWTDVPGMMTTNPKDVSAAKTVPSMSYNAALQLAEHGAKVLYAPTVAPVMNAGIPFRILNTFDPSNPGTTVGAPELRGLAVWRGIAKQDNPDGTSTLCIVGEGDVAVEKTGERITSVLKENGIRILSGAAGKEGAEAPVVSGDSGRIQLVKVHSSESKAALCALHREFFEEQKAAEINLFIAGHGAVGKELLQIVEESRKRLASRTGRCLKVVGLADSRRYVIDLGGVSGKDLERAKESGGKPASTDSGFFREVLAVAPRGSVLIDCTNSEETGSLYESFLERRISVISSNRRAISGPYCQYAAMKAAARENGAVLRYDTTVGTALPILESISSSANSCDRLESIEALVSCTLNYVISSYDGANTDPFAVILKKAQDCGLTEADPRLDLGGRDALRKLLILAREAGIPLEEEDVEIVPMLGKEYFNCPLDEFYALMAENEPGFIAREKELDDLGQRQRFIASIVRAPGSPLGYKASIRMQLVGEDSPFFHVSGTENIIKIQSDNIRVPLVIRGAGEGARQAASGIINDILKG